jgi:hypothetical protein
MSKTRGKQIRYKDTPLDKEFWVCMDIECDIFHKPVWTPFIGASGPPKCKECGKTTYRWNGPVKGVTMRGSV